MGHGEEEGGTVDFGEFQLKKSVLTPEGPIYGDLKVFLLR
jgi:2'-5' RNA ligase